MVVLRCHNIEERMIQDGQYRMISELEFEPGSPIFSIMPKFIRSALVEFNRVVPMA